MSSNLGWKWAVANWSIPSQGTWVDVDVILVSNLCTVLGADTVAMSIGLFVEACADTDIMSFGTWATNGNPNLEIE